MKLDHILVFTEVITVANSEEDLAGALPTHGSVFNITFQRDAPNSAAGTCSLTSLSPVKHIPMRL